MLDLQEDSSLDATLTVKPSLNALESYLILEAVTLKNLKGTVWIWRGKQSFWRSKQGKQVKFGEKESRVNTFVKWCESTFCSRYSTPLLPPYGRWFLRGLEVFDVIVKSWRSGFQSWLCKRIRVVLKWQSCQNSWTRIFTNGVWLTVSLKEFHRGFWFVARVTRLCSGVTKLSAGGLFQFPGGAAA